MRDGKPQPSQEKPQRCADRNGKIKAKFPDALEYGADPVQADGSKGKACRKINQCL